MGGRLRIGDKLMLAGRNLHDVGLMNGSILRLLDHGDEKLTVSADGLIIELPDEEAPRLQLAYACRSTRARASSCPSRSSSPTRPPAPTSCAARCSTPR